jgi:hypothetical protein
MGLMILHARHNVAGPAWRGIRAALAREALASILASRRRIQADRKVGSLDILRVMSLDPVAFLGRRIIIRRHRPSDR